MTIRLILNTLFLSLIVTSTYAGGGWTQPRGSGFFKLGQHAIRASRYFQPDGSIADITTISLYTTSVYAEYGLNNRVTVLAYVPFFVRSTLNSIEYTSGAPGVPGDFVNSFGDTNLGVKYGLLPEGPLVISVGITLGLPLGATSGGETGILQTGDGEFNQLLTVEASRAFGSFYATALLGFNNRTKDFSDEFRCGVEVGYMINNKVTAQLRVFGVNSLMNGEAQGGAGNSIFANDTEFLSVTPEIAYQLTEKAGISASVGTALYGKKILASPNVGVGLFLKL